jgi:hypothetical protein
VVLPAPPGDLAAPLGGDLTGDRVDPGTIIFFNGVVHARHGSRRAVRLL